MTIDHRSLNVEERARVDFMAAAFYVHDTYLSVEQCYDAALRGFADLDRHSRALFGETEKVCPNCGEMTSETHVTSYNRDTFICRERKPAPPPEKEDGKVECPNCFEVVKHTGEHARGGSQDTYWTCQRPGPAQPEPVAEEMPEAVSVNTWQLEELLKYADLAEVSLRTGFHPPEFLFEPADRSLRQCIDAIKEQRDQWRTHSAQPAKVRMTKELRRALDAAEAQAGWHMDQGRPKTFDEIDAAIAAVRAQAAEAGKVRDIQPLLKLAKERYDILIRSGAHEVSTATPWRLAIDAAEGRK